MEFKGSLKQEIIGWFRRSDSVLQGHRVLFWGMRNPELKVRSYGEIFADLSEEGGKNE